MKRRKRETKRERKAREAAIGGARAFGKSLAQIGWAHHWDAASFDGKRIHDSIGDVELVMVCGQPNCRL